MARGTMRPMDTPTHGRLCKAHTSAGQPCRKRPIKGALVCGSHGGRAPQVQRAARQRLLEAADPAAACLVELLKSEDENIRLRAGIALLDRSGNGPSSTQFNVPADGEELRYIIEGLNLDDL